jgi:hypothetical protein
VEQTGKLSLPRLQNAGRCLPWPAYFDEYRPNP